MTEAPVTVRDTAVVLADHTTLRVGGPARRMIVAETDTELVDAVRELDAVGEPVLVLGGGSNLLISDAGFVGTVVKVATWGISPDVSDCAGALVTVAAGEDWDDLVARTVAEQWSGLEALSGIPGSTGATPIQNVGAYGSDVAQTIATVRTLDRRSGRLATFAAADCGFSYRASRFKVEPGRYLVLSVTFQLRPGSRSGPIAYPELAGALGVEVGDRADLAAVRAAVLAIRGRKGMVLDEADADTWSAGSFFTNPILPAETAAGLPGDAPRFPQPDGRIKTSAAWLIERAGYGRGFGTGPAQVSSKHSLALTNRGGATAADLLDLARTIRTGVAERYGLLLEPEPVLVGCAL